MLKDEDIQKYMRCMEEVKGRLVVINAFISKKVSTGHPITDEESICLQFRKILELIALSSLTAHREKYEEIRNCFKSDWNAKRILDAIEKINPDFYPVPIIRIFDPKIGIWKHEPVPKGYLIKDELVELFDVCGCVLHAENPYSQYKYESRKLPFVEWRAKIMKLLNDHTIQLVNRDYFLYVGMQEAKSGKAHFAVFKKTDISPP